MIQREREINGESPVTPDKPCFLRVDPADLIADNPAALIVNKETYESMERYFSEVRFSESHPEVAWVEIYTPQGATEKLLVIDGLTRTKFANDHKGKVLPGAPNMKFDRMQVFNITEEVLKDSKIVYPEERRPGQHALTIEQFLRTIVPFTIEHREIAPGRIAGQLVNAWALMVGPDLAERFPAVSALAFLANSKTSIATDNELRKTLARQKQMVNNEQKEDRDRLDHALCQTAAIIRLSRLQREEVEQAAYFLVGSGAAIIGGSEETKRQIHGMLRSVVFENKLTKEHQSQVGPAENVRLECARALEEAFARLSDGSPDSERSLTDIRRVLDDSSLNIDQTLRIITAESPDQEYIRVIREMNKQALVEQYRVIMRRQTLTDEEQTLINNAGNQTYLIGARVPAMAEDIQFTAVILQQSRDWQRWLETEADDLVKQGVDRATIVNAISQMSQRQQALLSADYSRTLTDRARQLQKVVTEFKQAVGKEMLTHTIGESVSRVFSRESRITQDPDYKRRIVWAALHAEDLNASDPVELNRWMENLKDLDPDLRTEVIVVNMRMDAALKSQRNRKIAEVRSKAEAKPTTAIPVQDTSAMAISPESSLIEPEQQPSISPAEISRRRIERNVYTLRRVIEVHLLPAIELLKTIDLSNQEVPDDLKRTLGDIERPIEKFRGGHPDVVRVMDTDYPYLSEEVAKLRSTIVRMQQEYIDRDTRLNR